MLPIILALIAVATFLFYYYWISLYKKWETIGILSIPGKFPFGSSAELVFRKKFSGYVLQKMYYKADTNPYLGIYMMRIPLLLVKDPDIISIVLTKEFSHFRDRFFHDVPDDDPLNHHLFNLSGKRWRALRVKLTPTFTSGKMKGMFPLFASSAEAFKNFLLSKTDSEVNIKQLVVGFTTDVICTCAFGLETNTVDKPDHEIRTLTKYFNKNPWFMSFLRIAAKAFPQLEFRSRKIPIELEKYLIKLIDETSKYREKNGIVRNDFLDLLIQLKNKGSIGEDMKEEITEPIEMNIGLMTAQAFVFLFAGFETSSLVQSYCLYELAIHQEIQEKLREEIDKVLEKHGEISYEAVREMEYLHMIISETMRKYPILPSITRVCIKPFTMPAGHHLERGDNIIIPVWALHHDPQYFPDPDNFNPERFSSENKGTIRPFTYMPFGEGPRICIGNRFGLLQTKMGIITFIKNFKVQTCEKTIVPIELAPISELTIPKKPIILKLVSRSNAL